MTARRQFIPRCTYYRGGAGHPTCKRGVEIRDHVGGPDFGWMRRIPCVRSKLSQDVVPCDQFEADSYEWARTVLDMDFDEALTLVEVEVFVTEDA